MRAEAEPASALEAGGRRGSVDLRRVGPPGFRAGAEAAPGASLTRALQGAVAGAVATSVMTAYMIGLERAGVMTGQPPRMIVDHLFPQLDDDRADIVALVLHVGFGSLAGAAFASVTRGRTRTARLGSAYGLLIWATSYEGWVPALDVLSPAHRDRPGRVATMLTAHVLYGSLLSWQLDRS